MDSWQVTGSVKEDWEEGRKVFRLNGNAKKRECGPLGPGSCPASSLFLQRVLPTPLSLSPRNKIAHSRVNEVNDVNGVNHVNDVNHVNHVNHVNDVNNVNDIHDADEELLRKIVYKILENGRI